MTFAVPVPPPFPYFWLKLILAVVAILSFSMVLLEQRVSNWWHQQTCQAGVYAAQKPFFYRERMNTESYRFCGDNISVLYSGLTRTPLWVAEYLSAQATDQAPTTAIAPQLAKRHTMLLDAEQLEEYRYDALLSLNTANQPLHAVVQVPFQSTKQAQRWQQIDESLKQLSQTYHQDLYVITGTDYSAAHLTQIAEQLWVPHGFYKAVYIPETGVMSGYYVSNQPKKTLRVEYLSICALEEKLQMQLFPQFNSEQKRDVYQLPLQASAEFEWQYAYWDSKSSCEPETLAAQAQQPLEGAAFAQTPWRERVEATLLSLSLDLLHWLFARL